tara:strand:- start:168 stop:323 length:156 start_codon:yes stop_codon:yes gene_type:complete
MICFELSTNNIFLISFRYEYGKVSYTPTNIPIRKIEMNAIIEKNRTYDFIL